MKVPVGKLVPEVVIVWLFVPDIVIAILPPHPCVLVITLPCITSVPGPLRLQNSFDVVVNVVFPAAVIVVPDVNVYVLLPLKLPVPTKVKLLNVAEPVNVAVFEKPAPVLAALKLIELVPKSSVPKVYVQFLVIIIPLTKFIVPEDLLIVKPGSCASVVPKLCVGDPFVFPVIVCVELPLTVIFTSPLHPL